MFCCFLFQVHRKLLQCSNVLVHCIRKLVFNFDDKTTLLCIIEKARIVVEAALRLFGLSGILHFEMRSGHWRTGIESDEELRTVD